MDYIYETHCHSSQASRCAHSTAGELVRAYHAAGYAGLVLTDHFVTGNTAVDRTLPWQDQMQRYYDAFLEGKEAAKELDFDVIFGIEHACAGGEFLCYGIDLPFLLANPDLPELTLEELIDRVHGCGGVVIQAHPFRWAPAGTPLRQDVLDGIEIYNAANAPDANQAAMSCASGICTSGGDVHIAQDLRIGKAGIVVSERLRDGKELVRVLKNREYRLLIDEECCIL